MKTAVLDRRETEELSSLLRDAIKEMAKMREEDRKNNAEIARLRNSTRKRLDRIRQGLNHAQTDR